MEKQCAHPEIVILDDDDLDIMIIEHTIKNIIPECVVHSATCREELLNLLKSLTPDIILSDINLHLDEGFAVAELVGNSYPDRTLPFVFMTGAIREDHRVKAQQFSPGLILEKPMGREESTAFVNDILTTIAFPIAA